MKLPIRASWDPGRGERIARLRRTALFRRVSPALLDRLLAGLQTRELAAGSVICRAGDPGDAMFVIAEGSVAIVAPGSGAVLGVLEGGDAFGESALLDGSGRAAGAVAGSEVRLLALGRQTVLQAARRSRRLRRALPWLGREEPDAVDTPDFVWIGPGPDAAPARSSAPSAAVIIDPGALLERAAALVRALGAAGERASLLLLQLGPTGWAEPGPALAGVDAVRVVLDEQGAGAWLTQVVGRVDRGLLICLPWPAQAAALWPRVGELVGTAVDWPGLARPDRLTRSLRHRTLGLALGGVGPSAGLVAAALTGLTLAGIEIDALAAVGEPVLAAVALAAAGLAGLTALGAAAPGQERACALQLAGGRALEELPVRLALVALDLESGRQIRFDRGPVAGALRACWPGAGPHLAPPLALPPAEALFELGVDHAVGLDGAPDLAGWNDPAAGLLRALAPDRRALAEGLALDLDCLLSLGDPGAVPRVVATVRSLLGAGPGSAV